MSYILEALKKAELQRDIGQVPGIGSEHEKPSRAVTGKWVWVVVVFLVLNLVLLASLLWPDSSPDSGNRYGTELARPDPIVRERTVVSVPSPVLPPPVATPARPAQPEVVLPATAPAVIEPEPEPLPGPVAAQPAPVELMAEQAEEIQPVAVQAATDLNSLPVWPQIPGHLFQQLKGGINLDVHVYSDLPQDRFVLINLQKYHAGDQLQEGPLLDEITQEGVILSFQGQQFRVRAQ